MMGSLRHIVLHRIICLLLYLLGVRAPPYLTVLCRFQRPEDLSVVSVLLPALDVCKEDTTAMKFYMRYSFISILFPNQHKPMTRRAKAQRRLQRAISSVSGQPYAPRLLG